MRIVILCVCSMLLAGCMSGGTKRIGHDYLYVDAGASQFARSGISFGRLIHCSSPVYIKEQVTEIKNQKGEVVDTETFRGPYCDQAKVVDAMHVGSDPITGKVVGTVITGGAIVGGAALLGDGIRDSGDKTNINNGSSSQARSRSLSRSKSSSSSMSSSGMMPRGD